MKDKTILKKAIEKAAKNRYKGSLITKLESGDYITHCGYIAIIFSHSFSKAFWGECDCSLCKSGHKEDISYWQFQLQQMVLEKEPLKYLRKFL